MPELDVEVQPGYRLRLRCGNETCWVGDVEVAAKGGTLQHSPSCPHCRQPLDPQGFWPRGETGL